jgi:hypothetical protein
MGKRVKTFDEYQAINEALISWPNNWKDSEVWKRMEGAGFYDATTPLQRRLDTIMIKSDSLPDEYNGGIVFQKSGYIRNKNKTSGWMKNYKGQPYSIESMLNYVIDKFTNPKSREKSGTIWALLGDDELDAYMKENPLDLHYLDNAPEVKAGVLRRTGMKDMSRLGRLTKSGLI